MIWKIRLHHIVYAISEIVIWSCKKLGSVAYFVFFILAVLSVLFITVPILLFCFDKTRLRWEKFLSGAFSEWAANYLES